VWSSRRNLPSVEVYSFFRGRKRKKEQEAAKREEIQQQASEKTNKGSSINRAREKKLDCGKPRDISTRAESRESDKKNESGSDKNLSHITRRNKLNVRDEQLRSEQSDKL